MKIQNKIPLPFNQTICYSFSGTLSPYSFMLYKNFLNITNIFKNNIKLQYLSFRKQFKDDFSIIFQLQQDEFNIGLPHKKQ